MTSVSAGIGPETMFADAVTLLQAGRHEAAQHLLERVCRMTPDAPLAWEALGRSLLEAGSYDEAEEALAEAETLEPGKLAVVLARGEAAMRAGNGERELARLQAAAVADPLDIAPLVARGVLLMRLGRLAEAIDVLEAATLLAPDDPVPAIELCNALMHSDRFEGAEKAFAAAIALDPGQWLLRNNRGVMLMRLHRFEDARAAFAALLAERGDQPGLLCNLSNMQISLGDQDGGVATARRATELFPESHLGWRALLNALPYHAATDGHMMRAAAERAAACLPQFATTIVRSAEPERRLRVGLLSNTLRKHPVGWLTVAGFEHLDPAQFELVCCGHLVSGDSIARRFRAIATSWHMLDGFKTADVVATVAALDLDILIDLSGYGDAGVMDACASRLAPVQIKWVGMQNHSSGIPNMDWFITDRWETPPGFEDVYSERLLELADGYVCYSPPTYAPDVVKLPALTQGAVTFGCFNNVAKITPSALACWSEVLRRLPSARLVLKAHQFSEPTVCSRLSDAFAAHGVAPSRIEFRGSSPHRALLLDYNDIDIVLDPFPYTGGLTTCEALWMGVPTVTLTGELFSSRHATSHLANVGLPDWIAGDTDGYVALALAKAADLPALAELRAGLRARVKASPLCDGPRFGRSLGDALRRAWRDWCAAQS